MERVETATDRREGAGSEQGRGMSQSRELAGAAWMRAESTVEKKKESTVDPQDCRSWGRLERASGPGLQAWPSRARVGRDSKVPAE